MCCVRVFLGCILSTGLGKGQCILGNRRNRGGMCGCLLCRMIMDNYLGKFDFCCGDRNFICIVCMLFFFSRFYSLLNRDNRIFWVLLKRHNIGFFEGNLESCRMSNSHFGRNNRNLGKFDILCLKVLSIGYSLNDTVYRIFCFLYSIIMDNLISILNSDNKNHFDRINNYYY